MNESYAALDKLLAKMVWRMGLGSGLRRRNLKRPLARFTSEIHTDV